MWDLHLGRKILGRGVMVAWGVRSCGVRFFPGPCPRVWSQAAQPFTSWFQEPPGFEKGIVLQVAGILPRKEWISLSEFFSFVCNLCFVGHSDTFTCPSSQKVNQESLVCDFFSPWLDWHNFSQWKFVLDVHDETRQFRIDATEMKDCGKQRRSGNSTCFE